MFKKLMKKILLIGPQGSGKGTQAQRLSSILNIPALAMGQLLREEVTKESPIGLEVKAILDRGELVSDTVAAKVLEARLKEDDAQNGYILDGYPRNMDQYNTFTFSEPTAVVVIDLPRKMSMDRLSGRLTCNKCGRVASRFDGFKESDLCECRGVLVTRSDDTPEAIDRRLDIYTQDTTPVLEAYESRGLLRRVDGVGTITEVGDRILKVLDK